MKSLKIFLIKVDNNFGNYQLKDIIDMLNDKEKIKSLLIEEVTEEKRMMLESTMGKDEVNKIINENVKLVEEAARIELIPKMKIMLEDPINAKTKKITEDIQNGTNNNID